MRVITGIARGRKLISPEGNDVRPTVERTKEGIFSSIQFEIEGRKVLDLFAGSGQLGIEALSRGAESATFVDKSKASIDIVRKNVQATSFSDKSTIINTDSNIFVKGTTEKFHIAFLDPPYSTGLLQSVLPDVAKCMADGGIIVCEYPYGEEVPEVLENFPVRKDYKYGKIAVSVYRQE